jgi:hypothetical protein
VFAEFVRAAGLLGSLLISGASHAAVSELPPLEWRFEQYADPMHKGGAVGAASQTSESDGNDVVTVMVRCWSATGELDIRFSLGNDQVLSSEDVRWRFDKGAVKSARWRLNPRGNAMVVPQASTDEIVRDLRNGKNLEMLLLRPDGERSYHLALTGSSRAIGEMQRLCTR